MPNLKGSVRINITEIRSFERGHLVPTSLVESDMVNKKILISLVVTSSMQFYCSKCWLTDNCTAVVVVLRHAQVACHTVLSFVAAAGIVC